jgi:hypothetical protein
VAFATLVTGASPSPAQAQPFATPWPGHDAGESAHPGNPDPFERDPYAIAAADFDGDLVGTTTGSQAGGETRRPSPLT